MRGPRLLTLSAIVAGILLGALLGVASGRSETNEDGAEIRVLGKSVMGAFGDWTATVPTRETVPSRMLDMTAGCTPLYTWATARSAVPRGTSAAAFTLMAPANRALLVRGIRVVKGKRIPTPKGRDVECANAVDHTLGYGIALSESLNLDDPEPDKKLSQYVRPGGVTGGIVAVSTRKCSCQWWIDLDVIDNGKERTIRIDDDGKPFAVAPPVASLATMADRASRRHAMWDIPLARQRHTTPAADARVSARGFWASPGSQQPWIIATDRELVAIRRIAANMDVPRVPCDRMYRTLIAAGGRPTGHTTFLTEIASPTDTFVVADISVHIEKVEPIRAQSQYTCHPDGWQQEINRKQENETVSLKGATVGATIPVATGERLDLYRETAGEVGEAPLFIGVDPGDAVYWFTMDVRLTERSGTVTHLTLSDNGKPFVVAGEAASVKDHAYFEIGNSLGLG